jgi:hypothetical protein
MSSDFLRHCTLSHPLTPA